MAPVTVRPQDLRRARQFAAALEAGHGAGSARREAALHPLVRLAGGLGPKLALGTASDDFRFALRNRLLAVGAVGVAPAPALVPAAPWRRRLVAATAVVAVSTGGAAATAVASSDALPGDRLYEVKRAVEQVQLALAASELDKGKRYLAIAGTRLAEVQELLARNPRAGSNPALVQELRDTLSAASAALAEGSERFFTAFGQTANAAVLAPLEQFLTDRADALTAVRRLLPAELLPKQDSLIGELEVIAARVATVTGHVSPALSPAAASSPLVVDRPAAPPRASRSYARAPVADESKIDRTVRDIDATVAEAHRDAEREAAAAAAEQSKSQAQMRRDVRKLIEVDMVGDNGRASVGTPTHHDAVSAGPARARPGPTSGAGSMLLNLLPLPENSLDASIPGSLSASLDFGDNF